VSDSAKLERRYRRLLACYPRAFRQEHEQEILGVLMAGEARRSQEFDIEPGAMPNRLAPPEEVGKLAKGRLGAGRAA